MDLNFPAFNKKPAASPVGKPHAHARVFHGTGDPCVWFVLIDFFYRLQRLRHTGGRIRDLPVGKHLTRTDGIAVADLPRRNPDFFRQKIQVPL